MAQPLAALSNISRNKALRVDMVIHPITMPNLSILKNQKAKAIKLSTLNAICQFLDCQPGDILEYVPDDETP